MKQTKQKLALALVFSALLLTGCSSYGDVETLLRAPPVSYTHLTLPTNSRV